MPTEWMPITQLADALGASPRSVRRAIDDGELVDGHRLEERDCTDADYQSLDITRRTKRLVRAVELAKRDEDDEVARAVDETFDEAARELGSLEDSIAFLLSIANNEEVDFQSVGGVGGRKQADATLEVRQRALMNAEKLREQLAERDRLYIPRELVAMGMVTVAQTVRDRLQAVPSRLAEEVAVARDANEARRLLAAGIDEVLMELGDSAERELERLLEGEG